MPFGDKTGPRGEGAMTGWGRGYCASGDGAGEPGRWSTDRSMPLRNRRGFGRGSRCGDRWRNRGRRAFARGRRMDAAPVPSELGADGEVRRLRARAANVKSELNALEDRLARLEAQHRRQVNGKTDD